MSERENQIFTDYLGDPVSMCKRIAELEAQVAEKHEEHSTVTRKANQFRLERDRLREAAKSAYNGGLERAAEIVLARVKDGEGDHIFQIRNANLTTAADAIRAEIDK